MHTHTHRKLLNISVRLWLTGTRCKMKSLMRFLTFAECVLFEIFLTNKNKTFSGSEVCYFITHSANKHLQRRSKMAPHSVHLDEREQAQRYQRLQLQPNVVDWNSFPPVLWGSCRVLFRRPRYNVWALNWLQSTDTHNKLTVPIVPFAGVCVCVCVCVCVRVFPYWAAHRHG